MPIRRQGSCCKASALSLRELEVAGTCKRRRPHKTYKLTTNLGEFERLSNNHIPHFDSAGVCLERCGLDLCISI